PRRANIWQSQVCSCRFGADNRIRIEFQGSGGSMAPAERARGSSGGKQAKLAMPANGADSVVAEQERTEADVPELTREQELHAYREMLLIRRFEEKAGQLYGMGFIGGFCHLYIGQEAVVVGLQMCAQEGDQVITTYRDHGHMLACG